MFNINGALHLVIISCANLHSLSLRKFAGKSTINDEEGGNSDEKPQTLVQIEEEERRRRLSSDGSLG
jgi:hypothetical protein